MVRVLVVEDEANIRDMIALNLRHAGMEVVEAESAEAALPLLAQKPGCDAAILDVMLPGIDGVELLRRMREDPNLEAIPVVMATAKDSEIDKIQGLDLGADYYLTKPFGTEELLARIRVAVRHTRTPEGAAAVANSGVFTAGELTIDYDKHRVYIAGRDANLTQNEYKLVALLGLHAGKVLTYDYLIKELWGPRAP